MSVKIANNLNSPTLAAIVEQGILNALVIRAEEDWWIGVFEFGTRQSFQVVIVGPGLAWNETFPKREDSLEMTGFMSYAGNSAIEALRFLKTDHPSLAQASYLHAARCRLDVQAVLIAPGWPSRPAPWQQ